MKQSLSLLLTLLSISPVLAGPLDGIEWDKSAKDVLTKMPKSADFTLSPTAKTTGEKMVGGCTLNDEIAYQQWKITFLFDKKATHLEKLLFIGSESFDAELWDSGVLKSYYLFITNRLKERYNLGDKSINTPKYEPLSKVMQSANFYPIHSYKADGLVVTIGAHYDKSSNTIQAAFTLQKGIGESALGDSAVDNPNISGEAEEWLDITNWESQPAAEEFLTRVGVIQPKAKTKSDTPTTDNTITLTIKTGDSTPAPTPEEPSVEEPAPSAPSSDIAVDSSLPPDDQIILKAVAYADSTPSTDIIKSLSNVAKAGNARAIYQIATYTETGNGLTQDKAKADKFYLAAAQLGYALALVRIDGEFSAALASIGFSTKEADAIIAKTQEEAKGTSVSARFNLAVMYRYGYGVRKDLEKARTLLESLKAQGDIQAEAMLKENF